MKRVLVAIGLIVVTLNFSGCAWVPTLNPFNNLPHFALSNESVKVISGVPTDDFVTITISYETTDEHENVSTVVLADGPLVEGELKFNQEVQEPKKVLISVKWEDDSETAEATAFITPDETNSFIYIYGFNLVILKGKDHRSIDINRRFSITGDLSEIVGFEPSFLLEPGLVQVSVQAKPSVLDGSGTAVEFGPVLLEDGEFSIDGDLDEPTLVTVKIFERPSLRRSVEYLHAILEPGINYRVVPLGENGKWTVEADRESLHTKLVSSWQTDPDYVKLVDAWMENRAENREDRRERFEYEKEFVTNYEIAEECDHLKLSNSIKLQFADSSPTSPQSIGGEIVKKRSAAIREIMSGTQDLELARMAFELGWVQFNEDEIVSAIDSAERLALLQELGQSMGKDFEDETIAPIAEGLKYQFELDTKNIALLPGKLAPKFTLTSINGDEVSLSEVLSENELVLVDFWASWCGPCIRSFPALKKMYSKNKAQGFEIVTISIDDTLEDWESASEELEFPWIDLGDTKDRSRESTLSPTADEYGVKWIPNKFLIDKSGCIVHKHFSEEDLEKMLMLL